MARKRYLSDEKRDRPFVRIHLTTRNHPTYADVFADPTLRGMAYGLWQVARGAYAGKTDDVVTLTSADVNWICGTSEIRYGLPRLQHLCDRLGYPLASHQRDASATLVRHRRDASATPVQRLYRVTIRNFERKQFPYSATSRSTSTRTSTKTSNEHEKESERPRSARKRAPSADAVHFAEDYLKALQRTGKMRRTLTDSAFERWKVEADRMLRRDGIKLEEARELCAWIFRSEDEEARFWRATARSVPNFRRNYDQINAQRERAKGGHDGKRDDALAAGKRYAERHGLRGLTDGRKPRTDG